MRESENFFSSGFGKPRVSKVKDIKDELKVMRASAVATAELAIAMEKMVYRLERKVAAKLREEK